MLGLIVRRLMVVVPLLFFVSFIVFSLVVLIPGDAAQTLAGGIDAPAGAVEQVREEMNLDQPFRERYATWVGAALQGDFGRSLYTHEPIIDELWSRMTVTLGLAAAAFSIILPVALATGIIGGLRPGSVVDRALLLLSSVSLSIPGFWIGMVLVSVFAVWLGWLPPFGFTHFTDDPWDWAKHMILPAIAVSHASAFTLARQVRGGLADTMQTPFIRTAWAKGGTTRRVVVGHALKNSAMPAVTVLGLQVGALLGGSVLIEQIFNLPGLGTFLINAVNTQDVPVIQACAMLFVVIYSLASLGVDITYGFLNPKVRTS